MGARILIVEDHEPSLDLVRYLMQSAGHATVAEHEGLRAVARAKAEPPDLVICDMQLRDINGYDLVRMFREDANLRRVPLVAVTAFSTFGDRSTILAAGFVDMHFKPIDPETFVAAVEQYLPAECRAGPAARGA